MTIASRIDMDFAVLEMRIREKDVEIERLRVALRAILDDPEVGISVYAYAHTALEGPKPDGP